MKIVISTIFFLLTVHTASADQVKITMKDGNEVAGDYTPTGNQYCQEKYGGLICVDKSDIAKVSPYHGEELNKAVNAEENKKLTRQSEIELETKRDMSLAAEAEKKRPQREAKEKRQKDRDNFDANVNRINRTISNTVKSLSP